MAFTGLGLGAILVRELMVYPEKINILMGTVFYLTLFSSLIAITMIFGLSGFIIDKDESTIIILIISFTIIFQNLNMVIDHYFQYKVLSKYMVYWSTISLFISSVIKLLLIFLETELVYFAYALVFDSIIISIGFVYMYRSQNLSILNWKFELDTAKKLLKVSYPLIMVGVFSVIYTRIDQIMIKHMMGNEAVGNYAAAIRVSELFYFIPGIIVTSIFPKLVELNKNNREEYFSLLEKIYRLVVWASIPVAVFMHVFSDLIIGVLYGEQYILASNVLGILSWGVVFASIGAVSVKILYIEHYEKKYLYKSIFGVLVNVTLNYFLMTRYGINGAAIATLVTMFSVIYIYDLFDTELRVFYYLKIKCFIPSRNLFSVLTLK